MENENQILFTNFFTDETKPDEIEVDGEKEGYSDDVMIDLDGWRREFRVGWYDHDEDAWRLHDKDMEKHIDREHMKWAYLPLNENKKNHEEQN